jgi:hypothetical protein
MKKQFFGSMKNKAAVAGAVALGLATSVAHAAIDASVSTAFDAVKADAVSLSAIVTPIVVAILGLALVIKLIKRFGNKI